MTDCWQANEKSHTNPEAPVFYVPSGIEPCRYVLHPLGASHHAAIMRCNALIYNAFIKSRSAAKRLNCSLIRLILRCNKHNYL